MLCFPGHGRSCRIQTDSMLDLYRALEQTSLSSSADHRSGNRLEYKRSFVRRVNDPLLNDKLHRLRVLQSSLKVQQPFSLGIFFNKLAVFSHSYSFSVPTECSSSRYKSFVGLFGVASWGSPLQYCLLLCPGVAIFLLLEAEGTKILISLSQLSIFSPFSCSFRFSRCAEAQRLDAPLYLTPLFFRRGLRHRKTYDEATWKSTLCPCQMHGYLPPTSFHLCSISCWSCVLLLIQMIWSCAQHLIMHVCVWIMCVCFMGVQGVKHILHI